MISNTVRYHNHTLQDLNTFKNMINLTLYQGLIREKCEFYFPNIECLTLENTSNVLPYSNHCILNADDVQYLKTILNLTTLKSLQISSQCQLDMSSVLLKIFNESPQLSSLSINSSTLLSLLNDDQLCEYLNKIVKQLNLSREHDLTPCILDTAEKRINA